MQTGRDGRSITNHQASLYALWWSGPGHSSGTRSEIQTRLARPVKDPLALDETRRRRQLIQFVFDTLGRPHAQLLPKQSPRDSILFNDRHHLEYGLRTHFAEMEAIVKQMWAIPAQTPEGRRAKVLVALRMLPDRWRVVDEEADYGIRETRQLLIELVAANREHSCAISFGSRECA